MKFYIAIGISIAASIGGIMVVVGVWEPTQQTIAFFALWTLAGWWLDKAFNVREPIRSKRPRQMRARRIKQTADIRP